MYTCNDCSKEFTETVDFLTHECNHTKKPKEKMFNCKGCGYETDKFIDIELHECKTKEDIDMENSIKVGKLVRFSYDDGSHALGVVTWESGNEFKALWSDENSEAESSFPYYKDKCITGCWDVITYTMEENNMSKTIKGDDGLGTTTITTHEDKLTVVAEHMNNAYMAVQGILQAHADKNGEEKVSLKEERLLADSFNFHDFDASVKRTWKDQPFVDAVSNAALGLTGEAGEVADLIKKAIYHGRKFDSAFFNPEEDKTRAIKISDVKDELSDVLFYVSAMAQEFGFTLEDVALHNKAKLEKRYEKGFTVEESSEKKDKEEKPLWRYYDTEGNLLDVLLYPDSQLRREAYRVTYGRDIVKDRGGI